MTDSQLRRLINSRRKEFKFAYPHDDGKTYTYIITRVVKDTSSQLQTKCIETNELCDWDMYCLLDSVCEICWFDCLSVSRIQSILPVYKDAQVRADFQTKEKQIRDALTTCLLLGPRNVVPLLECSAAKDVYLVDFERKMALFALILFGGWQKVHVIWTDRDNLRRKPVGVEDIVLKTSRDPLQGTGVSFTYMNLDYNGTPTRSVWTNLSGVKKCNRQLKIIAIAGARRSFVVADEHAKNARKVFGKPPKKCRLVRFFQQPQMNHWFMKL